MIKEEKLPNNEIDSLRNLYIEYRSIILLITLLGVILSVVYSLWLYKPIYSGSALIQIGKTNGRLIVPTKEVEIKLLEKYAIYINPEKTLPKISDIKNIKTTNGIIRITGQGYNKEKLRLYLQNEIKLLSLEHNISLGEFVSDTAEKLKIAMVNLKKSKIKFQKIQLDIKNNDKKLNMLTSSDQSLINLVVIKMLRDDMLLERTRKRVVVFNREISKYEKYLLKTRTFPTTIIDTVVLQDKSVTPTKAMIIVIGFVSSLLFSLLMAFFLSFITGKKD